MNNPSRDAGIPVLTEIIEPLADPVTEPGTERPAPLPPQTEASVEELEARAAASMGSEDWARLERALRERILRQLMARVDNTLEQQVRDSLADVLQDSVIALADRIRDGLHHSLEEMIVRAVSQEIARLRGPLT